MTKIVRAEMMTRDLKPIGVVEAKIGELSVEQAIRRAKNRIKEMGYMLCSLDVVEVEVWEGDEWDLDDEDWDDDWDDWDDLDDENWDDDD